jgi:DNA-binding response OmpR family regulator
MRVLLVHSEPLTADVLAAMLRHQGYDVVQAATTQEAVLRSARHEADIVFLDLRASQTSAVAETVAPAVRCRSSAFHYLRGGR